MNIKDLNWILSYQSRVGPLKWIGPSTEDIIVENSKLGKHIVLVPVAFVSEHIQNPSNINDLVTELSNYLFPESIEQERIQYFVDIVLEDYEEYYWTGAWNMYVNDGDDVIVRTRLNSLIASMVNSAEFQLM